MAELLDAQIMRLGKGAGVYPSLIKAKTTQTSRKLFSYFFKVRWLTLNLVFSGSNGQNAKISLPIDKKIACTGCPKKNGSMFKWL